MNTFIQTSDMFHPKTDVKANLKLLTIIELRSILKARTQTFEKVGGGGGGGGGGGYEFTCFSFPYYLKQ